MEPKQNSCVKAVPSMDVFAKDIMKNKVVLVTGGGSGIGLGIAKTFARHGAKVAICGRTESKLQKAIPEIQAEGAADTFYTPADVREYDQCDNAAAAVAKKWGCIDVLVNSAAGNFMALAQDLSAKAFQTVVDIDLRGTFNMCKAALPQLSQAQNGATIINITATLQYTAMPFQSHAAAAKAGIDVLTQTLGVEWAEYGIRVVGIAPGPVAGTTGGPTGRVFGGFMKGASESLVCPVGRYGQIDDIANAALFLSSPAASWITSTTLICDGGAWHNAGQWMRHKNALRSAMKQARSSHKAGKSKL
eukprot:TRINITY_DN15383_c0_g1_i1.p1 TRINITY_DN15383_c0_g1~~TRINITY_DN15383_c0_g1_i1.p1  ORF type:complete len:304 (+),score=58.48 TRINITY_DN15383_c0_g1_i1:63-974(+)